MTYEIRPAVRADAATIYRFVCELAAFEKALDKVETSEEGLAEAIFGAHSVTGGLIAEVDGKPVGFAVYYFTFSTWQGRNGIYLEDLYVDPAFRGSGIGGGLLRAVANVAVEKNCGRMEWSVLDWNIGAIKVYDAIGGKPQSEWIRYRLEDETLLAAARG